jgi:hypothetical protein
MPESDYSSHSQINVKINGFNEMISQMQQKFKNTDSRSGKLKILTVLPKSWGIRRIEQRFQTSKWLARKARVVRSQGILSSSNPQSSQAKLVKCLQDTVNTFYEFAEVSRTVPVKEFKSVKRMVNGLMSKKLTDTW